MNILLQAYNNTTKWIFSHAKTLVIFIPFALGMLFALSFIFHIHDYHFVFPKSTLLYVLSSISFLASILIVFKYAQDATILKKIIQGILVICGILFCGFLLSELKILEDQMLKFTLIKIVTLILCLLNTVAILVENKIIAKSYEYARENRSEILMYGICLLPFIIYVTLYYPGAASTADTVHEFIQSSGYFFPVSNWHSVIVTMLMRLSVYFHLEGLSLIYLLNAGLIIFSAITISRTTEKTKLKYLLLVCTYLAPILMHHFVLIPKDSITTFSIMFAISMLIYSIFKKIDYHFYLGITFLIVASLIRHNQITQTIVLLIPFMIVYGQTKSRPLLASFKMFLIFVIAIVGVQKVVFNNPKFIYQIHQIAWIQGSDLSYILFDQNKSCKEFQSVYPKKSCDEYHQALHQFQKIQAQPLKKTSFSPMASFIYKLPNAKVYNTKLWLKYILDYPQSWFKFHSRVTLHSFLNTKEYMRFVNYKTNFNLEYWTDIKQQLYSKYNYNLGYVHFKQKSHLDRFFKNFQTPLQFDSKLYLVIFMIILTFILNKFKFFPTIMKDNLKYTCIAYYLSVSCMTLFIPLVLLIPTGHEARYLAGVDFPIIISIIMLSIYGYKKYKHKKKKEKSS